MNEAALRRKLPTMKGRQRKNLLNLQKGIFFFESNFLKGTHGTFLLLSAMEIFLHLDY